jgi:NRPS condensation-like uncharacterized protein
VLHLSVLLVASKFYSLILFPEIAADPCNVADLCRALQTSIAIMGLVIMLTGLKSPATSSTTSTLVEPDKQPYLAQAFRSTTILTNKTIEGVAQLCNEPSFQRRPLEVDSNLQHSATTRQAT